MADENCEDNSAEKSSIICEQLPDILIEDTEELRLLLTDWDLENLLPHLLGKYTYIHAVVINNVNLVF